MKRIFLAFIVTCLSTSFVSAGLFDSCAPCSPCGTGCGRKSLFDSISVYGWVQGGVYANANGATIGRTDWSNHNGRTVSLLENGNGTPLGAVQNTDFQVNQVWLGVKKEMDTSRGFDWGFRTDFAFGTDIWFTQCWNDAEFDYGWQDGDYYTSIPQVFATIGYKKWSVKVGKFETPLGYEALQAPARFFYSHSLAYMMEPYSHTGAVVDYAVNDKLTLSAGYTTTSDSSFSNKYDDHGFVGGFLWQATKKFSLSYYLLYNRYGDYNYASGNPRLFGGQNMFFHTLTMNYNLTSKLDYGFAWDLGDCKDRETLEHRICYGIANYLTYRINDRWAAGLRAEWMYENGFTGMYDGDMYEITFGLDWKPVKGLSIRPEIRYDWLPSKKPANYVFDYGSKREQLSGGVCAVYAF